MPQLNIYLADQGGLKARLDAGAAALGTTPNALARVVVEEFLEAYVSVATEAENTKRQAFSELRERLRQRSTALGVRRFQAGNDEAENRLAEEVRRPARRRTPVHG